jgi:hypothetical protein
VDVSGLRLQLWFGFHPNRWNDDPQQVFSQGCGSTTAQIRIRRGANPIGKDGTLSKNKGQKLILYHGFKSKHGPFEAMIGAVLVL